MKSHIQLVRETIEEEQKSHMIMDSFPSVERVYNATLNAHGESSRELRGRIMNYATNPRPATLRLLPDALQRYIEKIVVASYKVTDKDVEQLHKLGFSEDFIFEISVIAALGSGVHRFESGIQALG